MCWLTSNNFTQEGVGMDSVICLIVLGWTMGIGSILIKHLIDKFL